MLFKIEENPHCSVTTLPGSNEICRGDDHKITKSIHIHELNEDDFDRRKQCCEIMQELCNQNNGF